MVLGFCEYHFGNIKKFQSLAHIGLCSCSQSDGFPVHTSRLLPDLKREVPAEGTVEQALSIVEK